MITSKVIRRNSLLLLLLLMGAHVAGTLLGTPTDGGTLLLLY